MLDVRGRGVHETLALPVVGAERRDLDLRSEAGAQEPVGMELAQPAGIDHVGLPDRHDLGVARVHQYDVKPVLHEDVKAGSPAVRLCAFTRRSEHDPHFQL